MTPIKEPDYVLMARAITTYLDPSGEICGLLVEGADGRAYLLAMPGKVLPEVAKNIQEAVSTVHGILEWKSIPRSVAHE